MNKIIFIFTLSFISFPSAFAQDASDAGFCHSISGIVNKISGMSTKYDSLIKLACKSGKPQALFELSQVAEKKLTRTAKFNVLAVACKRRHVSSCLILARDAAQGKEHKDAREYYEKACLFDAKACGQFGSYYEGKGEFNSALDQYNKACEAKDSWACFQMAVIYKKMNEPKKEEVMYIRSCNINKLPKGCLMAGKSMLLRKEKDETKVRYYLSEACENDEAEACHLIRKHYGN